MRMPLELVLSLWGTDPEPETAQLDGRSSRLVQAVVLENMAGLRSCYTRQLEDEPTLAGRVETRFTIGPDGAVTRVETPPSTLANEDVEACIRGRFWMMQFPAIPSGQSAVVQFPLLFTPPGQVPLPEPQRAPVRVCLEGAEPALVSPLLAVEYRDGGPRTVKVLLAEQDTASLETCLLPALGGTTADRRWVYYQVPPP